MNAPIATGAPPGIGVSLDRDADAFPQQDANKTSVVTRRRRMGEGMLRNGYDRPSQGTHLLYLSTLK